MKKVVIIGGGISGLTAGWYHKQRGHQVTIVEKSSRVGGWIQTCCVDDFLFERGPRGFRPSGKGKQTLALVKELGLEKDLIPADKSARRRYLVHRGKLERFSLGLLLKWGLAQAFLRDRRTPPIEAEDETIADFSRRRFNDKITRRIIDPLTKGIFGGNAETLSMASCFPQIWEAEKKGSVFKNLKIEKSEVALYSFREGMEQLPRELGKRLEEHLLLDTEALKIEKNGVLLKGGFLEADLVIAAVPAFELTEHHPFTYAPLTTVNLGWKRSLLPRRGFGFLVPTEEKERLMGMTWDSEIFPSHNRGEQTRICVMLAGEESLQTALDAVKKYLKIDRPPDVSLVGYPSLPHYLFGHQRRLSFFQKNIPALLLGNTYTGVGINDCIDAAWKSVSL